MLIDDSENSKNIKNVSYLIPIGICLFSIIDNCKVLISEVLIEVGFQYEIDPYLTYWFTHLTTLTLVCVVGYFFIRRIWRRIVTGEFNCARLFISLLIVAIIALSILFFSSYIIRKFAEVRFENNYMSSRAYWDFFAKISSYVWITEFVILITVITWAVRSPAKVVYEGD